MNIPLPPKPGFHLVALVIISIICIAFGTWADEIHNFFIGKTATTSGISSFLKTKLPEFKEYGSILLLGGVSIYFISTGLEAFFKNNISPLLEVHVDKLSNQLEAVAVGTNSLLSAKLLSNIISASPKELVKDHLKQAHEKAFGAHCGNEHGLYTAVEDKFLKFYKADQPHRSDYNQTVTVVENDERSIIWHEVCTYKIHTVAFGKDYTNTKNTNVPYNLKFSSTVKVAELTFNGDSPKYSLAIIFEGNTIFNSRSDLELSAAGKVEAKKPIEGLKIIHVGSTLSIELDRQYQLSKEWTNIEIKETSTILDDYFISRRNEPTCGANINMNLPDGWSFELISFGHPSDWNIQQHPMNTLSATTKKWLLPGITFFCKWQRPDIQQLNL